MSEFSGDGWSRAERGRRFKCPACEKGSLGQLEAKCVCFCLEPGAGQRTETVAATTRSVCLCIYIYIYVCVCLCFCTGSSLEYFGLRRNLNFFSSLFFFFFHATFFFYFKSWKLYLFFTTRIILVLSQHLPFASGEPYSLVSTIHFIIRLHAHRGATWLRSVTRSLNRTPGAAAASHAAASPLSFLGTLVSFVDLVWLCVSVCVHRELPPPPPHLLISQHSLASRHETRSGPGGCGGAVSAALTCTGRTRYTVLFCLWPVRGKSRCAFRAEVHFNVEASNQWNSKVTIHNDPLTLLTSWYPVCWRPQCSRYTETAWVSRIRDGWVQVIGVHGDAVFIHKTERDKVHHSPCGTRDAKWLTVVFGETH